MSEEFFQCDCGTEAIGLEAIELDKPWGGIYLTLWEKMPNDWSWGYRLQTALQVLFRRNLPANEVVLNPQTAKRLGKRLVELADETHDSQT